MKSKLFYGLLVLFPVLAIGLGVGLGVGLGTKNDGYGGYTAYMILSIITDRPQIAIAILLFLEYFFNNICNHQRSAYRHQYRRSLCHRRRHRPKVLHY